MPRPYDVIVIGARCAGSPTALLLARGGHRVLLVDKATFPSDTMSTHLVHPPGVAALARWGVLPELEATNCPPVSRYRFDFGAVTIEGEPRRADGIGTAYCPRRIVLDHLLVGAAAASGVEVREGFTVDGLIFDADRVVGIHGHGRDGQRVSERAAVVVGADGRHSLVAKAVGAEQYGETPAASPTYYAYWSNLPTEGMETYIRAEHGRGWGVLPTHDELTCVVQGWPGTEFAANRRDIEGTYLRTFELAPEFAERTRGATRESRFLGTGDLAGYFRRPYGQGWALVGDAGYHKHPITAFGISDAFRDAELVAQGLHNALAGRRSFDAAMSDYQRVRDEVAGPMYGFTSDFALLEPPPPDLQALLAAIEGDEESMRDFISVMAATLPAPEFFGPDNVARIMTGVGGAVGG